MSNRAAPASRSARQQTILELRVRMLRLLLIATAIGSGLYLLAAASGLVSSRLYPWDGLGLLLLCGVCAWLQQRGWTPVAASIFISGASQPLFYASQFYGVGSPVNALFLVGLAVAGLLVGGWFVGLWTGMYCGWMLLAAIGEANGRWGLESSRGAWLLLGQQVLFWWVAFGLTGWLVWLFAHSMEQALQLAHGQTAALAQMIGGLGQAPDIDAVLGQTLQAIAEQLESGWAMLVLYEAGQAMLVPRLAYANGKLLPAEAGESLLPQPTAAGESDVWAELVRSRRPILISDVSNDPRLRHRSLLLAQGVQSILQVPLLHGDSVLGFFSLNSLKRRRYQADEIELASALAQQATLHVRLIELARQASQGAVLEERNRMAREIHDTLAQGLTGIVVQLEAAEDAQPDDFAATQAHIQRARTLARSSLNEARRSVWALRPQALEQDDLPAALQRLAQDANEQGPAARLRISGQPVPLPPDIEVNLLRIGQEALNNARRHAQASQIALELHYAAHELQLRVRDNGRGMDSVADGGFGLTSMRERAERLGGRLQISSQPQRGTLVEARIPLPPATQEQQGQDDHNSAG